MTLKEDELTDKGKTTYKKHDQKEDNLKVGKQPSRRLEPNISFNGKTVFRKESSHEDVLTGKR